MWFDTRAALAEIHGKPQPGPDLPDGAVEIPWHDPDEMPPEEPAPGVADVAIVAAPEPEITPDELARDLAFHEARIAALADPDGVARTPEAIEAVWDHAEAMARGVNAFRAHDAETDRPTRLR